MTTEQKFSVKPHADIELGVNRKDLEYFITFPDKGICSDTGLIFCIPGYGDSPESVYQKDKLRPYLANKYNCLVCGIKYFGIFATTENWNCNPCQEFIWTVERFHGISRNEFIRDGQIFMDRLTGIMKAKGVERAIPYARIGLINGRGEYQSFGFLPAIDHLTVLGEILQKYPLDRSRIIAFGTSYGGYIALLLGKYAPETFAAIIDNSGFSRLDIDEMCGREMMMVAKEMDINGILFTCFNDNPWTVRDDQSPFYLSDGRRKIRSLLEREHLAPSPTRYYIFHSLRDQIAPISEKKQFVNNLQSKSIAVFFREIDENDLDGKIFKTTEHGMEASLRGIFDLAATDAENLKKNNAVNDFELGVTRDFICADQIYHFRYNRDYQLQVSVSKK
ncbi:MAG: DUF2920 family protein [Smithellaceae bacterium]